MNLEDEMKSHMKIVLLVSSLALFACNEELFYFEDNVPPSVPSNIVTETGDELVIITWNPVYNNDLSGYAVYFSYSYNGQYTLLGTTNKNSYIDYGAANGETYYYAIASYDYDGNESELSYDVAYDTPRPQGFNQYVYELWSYPSLSGYDFSKYRIDKYNSENTDFFFELDNGTFYLNVWADTDIQNMGRTNDIYDISFAPVDGWVDLLPNDNIKYTQAIKGNTYIIWTHDNHFAKIRVSQIYSDYIEFDWAYQTAPGNVELKTNKGIGVRKVKKEIIVNRNK